MAIALILTLVPIGAVLLGWILRQLYQLGKDHAQLSATTTHIQTDITEIKGDIKVFKTEIKGDIKELRTEIKGDIKELRTEIGSKIDTITQHLLSLK